MDGDALDIPDMPIDGRVGSNDSKLKHLERIAMSTEKVDVHNIFKGLTDGGGMGTGAGVIGGGLGAGVLGGVLGGILLNRNGILGGEAVAGVTPAMLTAGLAQVTDTAQNTAVLQTLGDIKASVPLAESQVQLALAGTQANLTEIANVNQAASILGQAAINKNIYDSAMASASAHSSIKEAIASYGTANLTATLNAQNAIQTSVNSSTKDIIAALNEQNTANLQRQLTVAEQALLETRAIGRARDTEINVTQNVNQSQAQQQQQFQFQNLATAINALVGEHQTVKQGIINLGTMVGNAQTAANTRVA